jgi:hypothetical protein
MHSLKRKRAMRRAADVTTYLGYLFDMKGTVHDLGSRRQALGTHRRRSCEPRPAPVRQFVKLDG